MKVRGCEEVGQVGVMVTVAWGTEGVVAASGEGHRTPGRQPSVPSRQPPAAASIMLRLPPVTARHRHGAPRQHGGARGRRLLHGVVFCALAARLVVGEGN